MKSKALLLALALTFVGAKCLPTKPTEYGTALAVCLESSHSWSEYEPCCVDVAHKFGRDPGFCTEGADGLNRADKPADGGAQ